MAPSTATGVSNWNSTHIEELTAAGLPLPAVNQCPFNPYRGSSQMETVKWCQAHGVVFNGYSPLGIPDLAVDAPKTASLLFHKYEAAINLSRNSPIAVLPLVGWPIAVVWAYQHSLI